MKLYSYFLSDNPEYNELWAEIKNKGWYSVRQERHLNYWNYAPIIRITTGSLL